MSEGTAREIVARAALRDQLGQAVRAEWVRYCLETGDTKPSHIAPWDELSDWDKEADRRIADAVLTEAGALAPAGLTGDERWAVDFAADCLDGIVAGEQFDAYIRNRAAHHAGALRSLWRRSDSYAADAATGAPS